MVLAAPYTGFMCPVFVPYDKKGNVNVSEIPKYATWLAKKNVKAVLVNGTVGEGGLMDISERKAILEAWVKASKIHGMSVMAHIGGTHYTLVRDLARHAESIGVSSILCLPDLLFRPKTENELVHYLQLVSGAAPKTPLFYYHYPTLSAVRLDMVKFLQTGFHLIKTLSGIKYTDFNLDECFRCSQVHNGVFKIFLGCDQLILPALIMGLDCFIPTALNYAADIIFNIEANVKAGKNEDARQLQTRICNLAAYVNSEMNWINGFKKVTTIISGIKLGHPREPLHTLTDEQKKNLKRELKERLFVEYYRA